MPRTAAAFASLWASMLLLRTAPSAAEEIYRRALVLEDVVGRVELREAYGVRLFACTAGPEECTETHRVYDDVARLDFLVEHRSKGDGAIARSRTDRGTLFWAVAARLSDIGSLRELVEADLARLAPEAFAEPLAGWKATKPPPLDPRRLRLEIEAPIWICARSKDRFDGFSIAAGPPAEGAVTFRLAGYPEPLNCEQMAAATETVEPRIFETMPSPARLLEVVVEHRESVGLDGDPSTFLPAPPEIRVYGERAPAGSEGEVAIEEDDLVYSEVVHGDRRLAAFARPASIPLDALDRNGWLHRFAVITLDRRLGTRPREERASRFDLHVAYLPKEPPCRLEPPPETSDRGISRLYEALHKAPPPCGGRWPPSPPSVNGERWLAEIASVLERDARSPSELLEELVLAPAAGLESGDWLAVACRGDGTASYGLPPTRARARVVNGALFCGALAARVPEIE